MSLIFRALIAGIFIFATAYAQPKPGFKIVSSHCEANHGLLSNPSLNEVFEAANTSDSQNSFIQYQEGLEIKILPTLENQEFFSKHGVSNIRLQVKKAQDSERLYTTLEFQFEDASEPKVFIDLEKTESSGGEPMTALNLIFLEIIQSSKRFGYEGLLMSDCEAGFCRQEIDQFKAVETPNYDHLNYKIIVSHPEKSLETSLQFDLSKSLLGKLNAFQSSHSGSAGSLFVPPKNYSGPHPICLQLACENSSLSLDLNTQEMNELNAKFNRFTRHLHLLLKQAVETLENTEKQD